MRHYTCTTGPGHLAEGTVVRSGGSARNCLSSSEPNRYPQRQKRFYRGTQSLPSPCFFGNAAPDAPMIARFFTLREG